MLRRKPEVFAPTDGVLYVCADGEARRQVGADFSDPLLLDVLYPLAFRRVRISARDVELAGASGSEITAKVEVGNVFSLSPDLDVRMGSKVYEATRVEDRGRTCWLWLSEVATDGTCDLVTDVYEKDAVGIQRRVETQSVTVHVRRVAPNLRLQSSAGTDGLAGTLALRVRTADYRSESRVVRGGRTYTVVGAESHGAWTDLTCKERGSDRG